MDFFEIFQNHVTSRSDIPSWSRAMKFLKPFLDNPRVGWNKINRFETSKVFADIRHTSHIRQKWGNEKMKIIKFSKLCLMSANTFDVSNRLFLFHPTFGLSNKVFRSFIALLQLGISGRDITWFLKIPTKSIFLAQNSKKGQKGDFFAPHLFCYFEVIHVSDILWHWSTIFDQ